jgi:TolB-like protein/Tfp pilus assembly protein PilF
VGLAWAHRRLPESKRLKAFLYAAANLRDYLHLTRLDWPAWGPPLRPPGADRPMPDAGTSSREPSDAATSSGQPTDGTAVARRAAGRAAFEIFRARPLVAVLPFENRTGDPEQDYLADAITDELLIELSKIDWLMPISRDLAPGDADAARTAAAMGAELGVPYIVEGSVRRHGAALRITAVLEETEHGAKIWGARFDIPLDQLHELEDRMVTAIVAHVESKLKGSEQDRARRKPPDDLDAWDLAQRASWHLQRRTPEDDERAERLALEAIERDPGYSTPHAILATVYCPVLDPYRWPLDPDAVARAVGHARTAVRLDPGDGYAHGALGQTLLAGGAPEAALEQFERYAELNPSSSHARLFAALALMILGRLEEARRTVEIAITLSPHDAQAGWEYLCKGLCDYAVGDFEAAEASLRRSARRPATSSIADMSLAATLVHLGRESEAADIVARVLQESGPDAFVGARRFVASWRGPLVRQIRDDLVTAGLAPELWPIDPLTARPDGHA